MEAQIEYLTDAIRLLLTRNLKSIDVRSELQKQYNADIQRRLRTTTWNSGCRSWYLTDDGFNATMFPGFGTQFVNQLRKVDLHDYVVEPARVIARKTALSS
jgi:hypothetical protein